jgi:SAM-dependent methyltransferase
MTDGMLAVARRNAPLVAERIGYANVEFRHGRIQDLALDLDLLDSKLRNLALTGVEAFLAAEALAEELRREQPLIAGDSIDVVVSNCVLNLVDPHAKRRLFQEIFRVLRPGGRAVISDIVSDEPVPAHLKDDPELWSGCISGALTQEEFLEAFRREGFCCAEILTLEELAWRVVEGIGFRSMTVRAFKGEPDASSERAAAVTNGWQPVPQPARLDWAGTARSATCSQDGGCC